MTRIGKLLDRARQGRVLSFAEFCRLIEAFGFRLDRQRGSHQVWRRDGTQEGLTIQPRGKDAKPYQVRQFFAIVDTFGLIASEDME